MFQAHKAAGKQKVCCFLCKTFHAEAVFFLNKDWKEVCKTNLISA
jgi:hypothetical protein